MRKVLYVLNKGTEQFSSELLAPSPSEETTAVLIQDAVLLKDLPLSRVYALAEDVTSRNISSPFPQISYQDFLRMMFEADAVIAL